MLSMLLHAHTTEIAEVKVKKMEYETLTQSRLSNESVERFGKIDLVIDYNRYVLSKRYWNEGMTDIFIHDSVNELQLIK